MEKCQHYFSGLNDDCKIDNVTCNNCGMTYYQFLALEIRNLKQKVAYYEGFVSVLMRSDCTESLADKCEILVKYEQLQAQCAAMRQALEQIRTGKLTYSQNVIIADKAIAALVKDGKS